MRAKKSSVNTENRVERTSSEGVGTLLKKELKCNHCHCRPIDPRGGTRCTHCRKLHAQYESKRRKRKISELKPDECPQCFHTRDQESAERGLRVCKNCRQREKIWREKDPEYYRIVRSRIYRKNAAVYAARRWKKGEMLRNLINMYKDKPCADCSLSFEPLLMDFDHVRGDKVACISSMASGRYSLKAIVREIEKCDLVCAHCHRKRTARRGQHKSPRKY